MRSFIIGCVFFGAWVSLSACTTLPDQNYLDAGARQHIKTVDGILVAKQSRIGADVKRNGALSELSVLASGATVIPMLLDVGVTSIRTAQANQLAKPMRENLEDLDYAWEFKKQVKRSLEGTTLDALDDFLIIRDEVPGLRGHLVQESEADAVLIVDMKYAFTADFQHLYVQSFAMLFPNHAELRQFQERPDRDREFEFSDNIYRNQFSAQLPTGLPPETTKAEHAAFWAELPREVLVDVLDRAALLMADAIANDIGIDDVDSDLDLLPEDYVLNTIYPNFNAQHAAIKAGKTESVIRPNVSDESTGEDNTGEDSTGEERIIVTNPS